MLQSVIQDFAGHPFQISDCENVYSFPRHVFWQDKQFDFEGRFCWLPVESCKDELEMYEYPYSLEEYWRIVDVNGYMVQLQAYVDPQNTKRPFSMVPSGGGLTRRVNEEILENGNIVYWIVLRESIDENGPQTNDQLEFTPEERLFPFWKE